MGWRPVGIPLVLACVLFAACSDDPASVPSGARYTGTFTITSIVDPVNGNPDTDAFNHLLNVPITFTLSFQSLTDEGTGETFDFPPEKYRSITTDEITLTFTGDPQAYLQKTVTPSFQDVFQTINLTADSGGGIDVLENFVGTPGDEYFGFEVSFSYDGAVDTDGFPVLEDFSADGTMILRRYTDNPSFRMTDFASGTLSISFSGASRL